MLNAIGTVEELADLYSAKEKGEGGVTLVPRPSESGRRGGLGEKEEESPKRGRGRSRRRREKGGLLGGARRGLRRGPYRKPKTGGGPTAWTLCSTVVVTMGGREMLRTSRTGRGGV